MKKQMSKRLLSWLLVTALLFTTMPVSFLTAYAEGIGDVITALTENTSEFLGGNGTEENPYLISTKVHLNNVRKYLDAHFKMVADIEFTKDDFAEGGDFYNEGQGWEPIGTDESSAFTGVFDGDGHTIAWLICHRSSKSNSVYAGVFGYNKGHIRNLGIIDGDISAQSVSIFSNLNAYAGGIVGFNAGHGTISNCYNTGSVNALVFYSSSRIDVFNTHAGGIVGCNNGMVTNCYNIGSVNATISTSFSIHSDRFEACAGGVSGYLTSFGTISNCYNTGSVNASVFYSFDYFASNSCAGGIVGKSGGEKIENCYYLDIISKSGVGAGKGNTVSCTTEQMGEQITFSGFDFDVVWTMSGNKKYPYPELQKMFHADVREENVTEFAGGNGTQYAPYLISNKEHLNNVRNHLGGHFKMMADIVFTEKDFAEGGDFYNDGQGWEPIGTGEAPFFGVFDGANHVIRGLVINSQYESPVFIGLFGYNKGTIQNLGTAAGQVGASGSSTYSDIDSYIGGLVGYNQGGTINRCYNANGVNVSASFSTSNTANSAHTHVGGLAGYSQEGIIRNCYNIGAVCVNVSSSSLDVTYGLDSYAGGIAGYNQGETISNCYNIGNVSTFISSRYLNYVLPNTGGIAGRNFGQISNCYNIGGVKSNCGDVGGITGDNQNGGIISNCYNTGSTSSQSYYIAGIAGRNTGTVSNCYYLDIISKGVNGDMDTTISCTIEQMKQERTFNGFDFESIWTMEGNADYLYPELQNTPMQFEKELVSIEVTTLPTKLEYLEGKDALDVTGGKLTLNYNNGISEVIDLTRDIVSGFDNTQVGPQTLTVTYKGKAATFEVEIVAKSLESIKLTTLPNKLEYLEGKDKLDVTGGKLTLIYNNGTTEVIDLMPDMVTGFDNTRVGPQVLTVTYKGKTATFEVTVAAKSLMEIKVTKKPDKLTYLEGDDFDPNGVEVTAYYNNGTSERVTDYDISGYTSTPGPKTITITYGGKTATFEVTVEVKSLTEIKVTKKPDKLTYLEGDDFDPTGMEVTAYYNNGTAEVVGDYQFSGYDSTPGTKTITISYGGKTTAFEVTIKAKTLVSIAVSKNPRKMTYIEGTNLDTDGMELTLTYDNGDTQAITTGWTETYDFSQPGQREVQIAYQGKKTTLTVTVVAKTLTSIVISKEPNKMTYVEGDLFDPAGMIVVAYYNNGSEETVTDRVSITGYSSTPGIKTITVSYNGKSAQLSVTVEAKRAVSIEWKKKPTKITYYIGEALSLKGAVILIHYNNGTTEQESLENTSFGADQFNPNKLGEQVIYIRIDGAAEISFTVTVKSRVPDSITSGTYTVSGGTISKIGAGTTVSQLLNGINEKAYCKVYKGNSEVSGNTLVSTGMEVRLLDGSTVKSRVTVVVTGDTNGDGNITITDMLAVKSHLLKKSTLSGAAGKAADTSGDKTISITDFIQIKAHILGKDKIQPRSC